MSRLETYVEVCYNNAQADRVKLYNGGGFQWFEVPFWAYNEYIIPVLSELGVDVVYIDGFTEKGKPYMNPW